jgi:hypothetical protein
MIEVFKTDVTDAVFAKLLLNQIHRNFPAYKANFDLEDCDRILRVEHGGGPVRAAAVIDLLKDWGIWAAVLSDDIPRLVRNRTVVSH